jgi:TonB family protein
MLLLAVILAADLSGTWVGSVRGGPMCLALSQSEAEITGNLAYDNDRKYAAISSGKLDGEQLSFEVADLDRGTVRFGFRVEGEKLLGDNGAVLTKWMPQRNWQFDAGLPLPPRSIHTVHAERPTDTIVKGTVKVSVLILTNGDVNGGNVKVLSSAGKELDEAAIKAILQWKFSHRGMTATFMRSESRLSLASGSAQQALRASVGNSTNQLLLSRYCSYTALGRSTTRSCENSARIVCVRSLIRSSFTGTRFAPG